MVTLTDKTCSRVIVVQILYILNLSSTEIKELTSSTIEKYLDGLRGLYGDDEEDLKVLEVMRNKTRHKFVHSILKTLGKNIDVIDSMLVNNLDQQHSWQRINVLLKSVLRAGVAEFIHIKTARKVLIDEYVNITSSFFSYKETSFINATLDKITKMISSNDAI